MATYSNTSPWANTTIENNYLGILKIRPVSSEADDPIYIIEPQYNHRPDLLAYDLYGTNKLWWVFIQRNMDTLKDPIYDFEPGTIIYLPKKSNLQQYLGV